MLLKGLACAVSELASSDSGPRQALSIKSRRHFPGTLFPVAPKAAAWLAVGESVIKCRS